MKRETTCIQTEPNSTRRKATIPTLRIRAQSPAQSPKYYELGRGIYAVTIGKRPDCGLVVEDEHVSGLHCEIAINEKGLRLRDLSSKNGTFIGDIEIVEAFIGPEACITVGKTSLTIEMIGQTVVDTSAENHFGDVYGESFPMRAMFASLTKAAASKEPILLIGESGTGKELLAKAIHTNSPQKNAPFVVFDCAAVRSSLAESALFGHVKGAFTGAAEKRDGAFRQASGGTLFIDEIGELPPEVQPKLLRALQNQEISPLGSDRPPIKVNVRIVAATHRDLQAAVKEGLFRQDLYYRLNVIDIRVPPLRERKSDIPLLVERILQREFASKQIRDLPENSIQMFLSYDWPGNVRELRHAIARLLVLGDQSWKPPRQGEPRNAIPGMEALYDLPLKEAKSALCDQFEKGYVPHIFMQCQGDPAKAAKKMEVSRFHAYRLKRRFGL